MSRRERMRRRAEGTTLTVRRELACIMTTTDVRDGARGEHGYAATAAGGLQSGGRGVHEQDATTGHGSRARAPAGAPSSRSQVQGACREPTRPTRHRAGEGTARRVRVWLL